MKVWQKQLILFVFLVALGVPLLFFWRGTADPPPSPVFTGPKSEYALALVDRRGRPLSDSSGGLQVRLDPFTLYRNQPDQRSGSFSIDGYGFRGRYRGTPRPLVVLGGSAAFGQGLESDGDSFAARLDGLVEDHEVVNAAVVGYLAGQELALMVHRLDDLNPSVYIAFDGWNELFDQWLSCPRSEPWDHGFMNLFFNVELRLHDLQSISDRQQQPAKKGQGRKRREEARKAGITKEMIPDRKKKKEDSRPDEPEQILEGIQQGYHAALGRMADFARARGARFVVVFQPELGGKRQPTAEEAIEYDRWCESYSWYRDLGFTAEYGAFVERAADWCAAEGIEHLDLHHHPAFRDAEERLFFDVVHLNAAGHQLAARLIHRQLQETGFLPPPAGR